MFKSSRTSAFDVFISSVLEKYYDGGLRNNTNNKLESGTYCAFSTNRANQGEQVGKVIVQAMALLVPGTLLAKASVRL